MPRPAVLSEFRRDNHEFGSILVDKRKLREKHVLSIQHLSRRNVNGWPNKTVSARLARVIHALVEEKDDEALKHGAGLSAGDRQTLRGLAHKARVALPDKLLEERDGGGVSENDEKSECESDSDTDGSPSEFDSLRDRFVILSGEVRVGNTSPGVVGELRGVVQRMVSLGVVTSSVGDELMSTLCK